MFKSNSCKNYNYTISNAKVTTTFICLNNVLRTLINILLYFLRPYILSKHLFDYKFVPKCKPLFKLLDAFIIFFPKYTLD